jgi:hypothetical protein
MFAAGTYPIVVFLCPIPAFTYVLGRACGAMMDFSGSEDGVPAFWKSVRQKAAADLSPRGS